MVVIGRVTRYDLVSLTGELHAHTAHLHRQGSTCLNEKPTTEEG
jgi:hypothetical protein